MSLTKLLLQMKFRTFTTFPRDIASDATGIQPQTTLESQCSVLCYITGLCYHLVSWGLVRIVISLHIKKFQGNPLYLPNP